VASLVGINPQAFLHADEIEVRCLTLVAEKAMEYHQISQQNQAALIIQFLAKALGTDKKQRGV
jgi:hypothetical protein